MRVCARVRARIRTRVRSFLTCNAQSHPQRVALWFLALALLLAAAWPPLAAAEQTQPEIALIIDDMGMQKAEGQRVIALPGPVACAFLPYAPHTQALARSAHRRHKEVILHLPMETVERQALDTGGLRLDMNEAEVVTTVQANLARVPHVSGVNNHMGSLLTRHPGHMVWLMRAMQRQPQLFFVDSRTTKHTVAQLVAYEEGVPSVSRDVFLDNDPSPQAVQQAFERLLQLARRNGSALAIGHPRPATLAVLEQVLPHLAREGVKLVPVSRLVERQREREPLWRASLFP